MIYNIDYNIAGMIFLLIFQIILGLQYSVNVRRNRVFKQFVLAVFLSTVMDTVTAVTISYAGMIPLWVNYVLNVMFYIVSVLTSYIFIEYIRTMVSADGNRICIDRINLCLVISFVILALTNPITHLLFYFDESRAYTQGPLYLFLFIFPMFYIVEALIRTLVRREGLTKREFWSTIVYISIAITGNILQPLIFKSVLVSYFTISVAVYILLYTFETPDYRALLRTTEDLRQSELALSLAEAKEKETNRRIHELMNSADWTLDVDEQGNMISANWSDQFRIMMGAEDETDIPDHMLWAEHLHPGERDEAIQEFLSGLREKRPFKITARLLDRTGTYRWYRSAGEVAGEVTGDENGRITTYQGVIQDVDNEIQMVQLNTDKLAAMAALKKSEDALKEALKQAESASLAKSQFLFNMSHDIRTPLNAIIGFTDLALEDCSQTEVVEDYLKKIQSAGDHLLLLINDILDMSRIESGNATLELAEHDISELMHSIEEMVKSQVVVKQLTLQLDLDGIKSQRILCDRLRLNQILLNCIGNSIKFTPEGGAVYLTVDELPGEEDGKLIYSFIIADTGIGMSQEFLAHMFDPFERERTSTVSKTQGTGLGMSITKSLVEMMGGTIHVESRVGEGTTFVINIPFEVVTRENEDDGSSASDISLEDMVAALSGKHFLLVDDNKTNRMLAKGVLKSRGMTCEEAEDGLMAVNRMLSAKPGEFDMILMDVQMPVMNGYEATDKIRKMEDETLSSIPILAMTANAFEEDRKECLSHGMNEHIGKPFKADELVRKLYGILFGIFS